MTPPLRWSGSLAQRATVASIYLGIAIGWNITNVAAIASEVALAYGISLATVGLFATALFLAHSIMQLPAGKATDRFGPRRVAFAGLLFMAMGNAVALAAPDAGLALAARAVAGVGTGLGIVAGIDYVRAASGSALAQGLFGGGASAGGGLGLALVPLIAGPLGWRTPFLTALLLAVSALPVLAAGPKDVSRPGRAGLGDGSARPAGLLVDPRLQRLAVLHIASFGLSLVVGAWVVTLLRKGGYGVGTASTVGALTLILGATGRPLGGWLVRRYPGRTRTLMAATIIGGAAGTIALAAVGPPALSAAGAALVGLASGIPLAAIFTSAGLARPDAPGLAVGLVNMLGNLMIVVGTPLLGLAFSLGGGAGGRVGFVVVGALWAAALLVLPRFHELQPAGRRA